MQNGRRRDGDREITRMIACTSRETHEYKTNYYNNKPV